MKGENSNKFKGSQHSRALQVAINNAAIGQEMRLLKPALGRVTVKRLP
jgi:hypothetical protein